MTPREIPRSPGCYLFRDKDDRVIYIGKAKDLKRRVSSYFQKKGHDPKTARLVSQIVGIDFIVTGTESEAFILENNLIKTHSPKYNIDLKDSKRYAYIRLTDERFPRVLIARKAGGTGKFYGPFTSAESRDYIIRLLKKTFRFRTCRRMPKRPCLRHHISLCDAPCAGLITEKEYCERVKDASQILKGNTAELIRKLQSQMKILSGSLEFETAISKRDQIHGLERLKERQTMERQKKYDEDVMDFIIKDGRVYVILFNVYKGTLENKEEFDFDFIEGWFEEFISRYYSDHPVPGELILSERISESLQSSLEERSGKRLIITNPKKGEKKALLDLVQKNIELSYFGDIARLERLKSVLKLQELPSVIECFDISHLFGTSTVGSMVQYRNGKPDKSNYRRFRIRNLEGIDDYKALGEVVLRRYGRLVREGSDLPDLIVIDGGKGQLNSSLAEMRKMGLKIPIISLAKRLEEIFVPGMGIPIRLKHNDPALLLLRNIRDEAHRFAIAYNRLLRKKAVRQD